MKCDVGLTSSAAVLRVADPSGGPPAPSAWHDEVAFEAEAAAPEATIVATDDADNKAVM